MSASDKYTKGRIADPVHGTIELSQLEMDLLSTRSFQRLHNVKQLGLANLVFPGADYSRFSHSLGVNHVTGKILSSLKQNCGAVIDDTEYELYRLAGLLHDVGHYPFSHTFENAVSTYYQDCSQPDLFDYSMGLFPGREGFISDVSDDMASISLDHEDVGRELLTYDPEIVAVLGRHGVDPADIHRIFSRQPSKDGSVPRFANLISSDLDADRIDYLSRTARHTGLPYGLVDIDYLLSQMRLDKSGRICLDPSALRTAEHFLLGRYFDYQQVNFHKTVAALEWALGDVISALLSSGELDCSPNAIRNRIGAGEWSNFDDFAIWGLIRELELSTSSPVTRAKVMAVAQRIPPKLIGSLEFFATRDRTSEYNLCMRFLNGICNELASSFGIPRDLWYVWGSEKMSLTKVGSYLPISMTAADFEGNAGAVEQSIFIKDGENSKPISAVSRSLMSVLSQNILFSARMYVVLDQGQGEVRQEILKYVRQRISAEIGLDKWIDG